MKHDEIKRIQLDSIC